MVKIIAIEGADRVGKKTQTHMMMESLAAHGYKASLVEVPVKSSSMTYDFIYRMLKNGMAKRWPNLFQFIQFLNKFIFQFTWLLWLHVHQDVVVLDRWSLSSVVYGGEAGANKLFTRVLYHLLVKPDLTIVLHGQRHTEDVEDVYEADTGLQKAVRNSYLRWVLDHWQDHVIVSNQGSRHEVHERMMQCFHDSMLMDSEK